MTITHPDIPWIIGICVLGTLLIASAVTLFIALIQRRRHLRRVRELDTEGNRFDYTTQQSLRLAKDSASDLRTLLWAALGSVLVFGGLLISQLFPFDMDYHQYREVRGTVTQVSHRLIPVGDKGGMAERYVVVVNEEAWGVDDTRASLLKEGDKVSLLCEREFQFNAESGWRCNWGTP